MIVPLVRFISCPRNPRQLQPLLEEVSVGSRGPDPRHLGLVQILVPGEATVVAGFRSLAQIFHFEKLDTTVKCEELVSNNKVRNFWLVLSI